MALRQHMEGKLELRALTERLGMEVIGYDFDDLPHHETARALRQALLDHHLLLFRGRFLDSSQHIAFAKLFGGQLRTGSPRPPSPRAFPETADICAPFDKGQRDSGRRRRGDAARPGGAMAISVYHVVVAADSEARYTGLASAYERLPPEGRRQVSRMRMRSPDGATHSLVLPHPVTGRLGLCVDLDCGAAIIDEFGHENRAMREGLERYLSAEGTCWRHRWRAGDTVVVDDFAVMHRVTGGGLIPRTSIGQTGARWSNGWRRVLPAYALMAS